MQVTIDLSRVNMNDEVVKPIAHFDRQTINVMTEEELLAWVDGSEELLDVYAGVDWETYRYVMPIGKHGYYSFKKEWIVQDMQNLKIGETCYPRGRADVSVTKTDSATFPVHYLDGHGYEYSFDTIENCQKWIEGDRADIHEGIHFV